MNLSEQTVSLADVAELSTERKEEGFNQPDGSAWVSLSSVLLFALGLAWGGITAFSMAFEDAETKIQSGALLVAWIIAFVVFRIKTLLVWLNSTAGLLLAGHVTAALVSGVFSDGPMESTLRYAALLPAFSVLLCVAQGGANAVEKVRFGLTAAGLFFVAFHLTELDFGSLADPRYRITVFLNTNSTAFIAAMTGLSAVEFVSRGTGGKWARTFWLGALLCCALLLFGTKSRTALLAMLSGIFILSLIRFRTKLARIAIVGVLMVAAAYATHHRAAIIDTLSLDDKDRSIETGTGRYEIWGFLLTSEIPKNPWFGVGPGQHNDLVFAATGSSSAHNGLLASLSETGIVGTWPLLLLTIGSLRAVWRRRMVSGQAWAATLAVAGIVESFGENVFFSIGNPASLLFMLAIATLAMPLRAEPQRPLDPENAAELASSNEPSLQASQ